VIIRVNPEAAPSQSDSDARILQVPCGAREFFERVQAIIDELEQAEQL
jgi:hypothetical protein